MNNPHKVVWQITRRGTDRAYWTRIGVAFVNRDGSLNVILNCLPLDGKMQIRDYVPRDAAPTPPDRDPPNDDDIPF